MRWTPEPWLRDHQIDVALALVVLCLSAPLVQVLGAQQASRMALTAAIWDDHSLEIDGYPLGVDRAERDGRTYSDKAPGQPIFALAPYGAYRALGGEPASVARLDGNLGLWFVSVWSSALPAAALAVVVRHAARRVAPATAVAVALATATATLLLPLSTVLFGHVLATLLGFGAWVVAARSDGDRRELAAIGALLGAAVLVEYTMVLVAALIAIFLAVQVGRRVGALLVGALPAALILLWYQWAAFGHPLNFSYANSAFGDASKEAGLRQLDLAPLENATRVLVGERGLIMTPVVFAGAAGLFLLVRQSAGRPRMWFVCAALCATAMVGVQMLWSNPTGGDSPGARYATAAAAFASPGLALAWSRWRRLCAVLAIVGGIVMLSASWTNPLAGRDADNVVRSWWQDFFAGHWANSIYEMAFGETAAIVLLPTVAGLAGIALIAACRVRPASVTDVSPPRDAG